MRYDNLLRSIEKASARYEAEIQQILQRFAKTDATTSQQIVASLKKPKKKLHWTQRPENKSRLKKQLKNALKVRNGTI